MAERTEGELADHFLQPAEQVVFVRYDLSEEEVEIARKCVRDGESVDSVVDDFYDRFTEARDAIPGDDLFTESIVQDPEVVARHGVSVLIPEE